LGFGACTETVTAQLPGFSATNLPPETLQIFLEALDTVSVTLAFAGMVAPRDAATAELEALAFTATFNGAGAAAGAAADEAGGVLLVGGFVTGRSVTGFEG
jgi:hypothetical protein